MCWPEKKHLEHRRTASTGKNHLRTTAADSSRPQVVKAGSKRDPLEEWPPLRGSATSASGDASSDKEQKQGCFNDIINSRPAQTTATLSLQQHDIAGYGSPHGNANVCGVCVCCYQREVTAFGGGESIDNSELVQGIIWHFLKPLVGRQLWTRK